MVLTKTAEELRASELREIAELNLFEGFEEAERNRGNRSSIDRPPAPSSSSDNLNELAPASEALDIDNNSNSSSVLRIHVTYDRNQDAVKTSRKSSAFSCFGSKASVKGELTEVAIDVAPDTTLEDFKNEVAPRIKTSFKGGIPNGCYANFLYKGKLMADDAATLASLGLKDGSKLTAMHTAEFSEDRPQLAQLAQLDGELKQLEDCCAFDDASVSADRKLITHKLENLVTKLDGVETAGRPGLRATRKALVARAIAASDHNKDKGTVV